MGSSFQRENVRLVTNIISVVGASSLPACELLTYLVSSVCYQKDQTASLSTALKKKTLPSATHRVAVLFNNVLYRGSATQVRIWWYYPAPLHRLRIQSGYTSMCRGYLLFSAKGAKCNSLGHRPQAPPVEAS